MALAFAFSACQKENVKNGNKHIIGTWTLESQKSESKEVGSYTYTFTTNDCEFESYTSSYSYVETEEINGSTVKESYTESETTNGTTVTESGDTTYTLVFNEELTFNEDGTCSYKTSRKDKDEDGNPDNYTFEYIGNWNWIDSYEKKTGINIVFGNAYFDGWEMYYYIETLEKDELKFTYTESYNVDVEYTSYYDWCYSEIESDNIDVYQTRKENETNYETGYKVMKK